MAADRSPLRGDGPGACPASSARLSPANGAACCFPGDIWLWEGLPAPGHARLLTAPDQVACTLPHWLAHLQTVRPYAREQEFPRAPPKEGHGDYFNLANHMLQLHQLNAPLLIFYFVSPSRAVKKPPGTHLQWPPGPLC